MLVLLWMYAYVLPTLQRCKFVTPGWYKANQPTCIISAKACEIDDIPNTKYVERDNVKAVLAGGRTWQWSEFLKQKPMGPPIGGGFFSTFGAVFRLWRLCLLPSFFYAIHILSRRCQRWKALFQHQKLAFESLQEKGINSSIAGLSNDSSCFRHVLRAPISLLHVVSPLVWNLKTCLWKCNHMIPYWNSRSLR